MCERQAGGYSLETIFTFLVSRCDKRTPPLSHRLTVFIFSGSPLQILLEGNLVKLLVRKRSLPAGGPYISSRAQFRSEARMFEHGMIWVSPGREGLVRPCEARMFEHGMIYRGLPRVSGHKDASGYARVFRPSRSGRRLFCAFGVCLQAPWWRWRCLRLRGGGVVLRR